MGAPACRVTLADQIRFVKHVRDKIRLAGYRGSLTARIVERLRQEHGWANLSSHGMVGRYFRVIRLLENPRTAPATELVLATATTLNSIWPQLKQIKEG